MQKIKTMPHREKYAIVLDRIKSHDVLLSPFIKKHLDEQALVELKKLWQEGVKPIPEDSSFEEKYEIAYGNLMWQGKSNLKFIRMHLGDEGIEQYKLEQVEELKRKNASPALIILGLLRAIFPGSAFIMTAKKMAYQIQWLLPPMFLVELTPNKAVYNIPQCKVISFPDMEEACIIDCQGTYPMWLAEQLKVGLTFERQGNSCTAILTRSVN